MACGAARSAVPQHCLLSGKPGCTALSLGNCRRATSEEALAQQHVRGERRPRAHCVDNGAQQSCQNPDGQQSFLFFVFLLSVGSLLSFRLLHLRLRLWQVTDKEAPDGMSQESRALLRLAAFGLEFKAFATTPPARRGAFLPQSAPSVAGIAGERQTVMQAASGVETRAGKKRKQRADAGGDGDGGPDGGAEELPVAAGQPT